MVTKVRFSTVAAVRAGKNQTAARRLGLAIAGDCCNNSPLFQAAPTALSHPSADQKKGGKPWI